MLTQEAALQEFRDAGALLEGHFILTSGYHSSAYLQCARVLMDPRRAGRLCAALAEKLKSAGAGRGFGPRHLPCDGGRRGGLRNGPPAWGSSDFLRACGRQVRVAPRVRNRAGAALPYGGRCCDDWIIVQGMHRRSASPRRERDRRRLARRPLVAGKASLPVPFASLISLDIPLFPPDQLPASLQAIARCQTRKQGLEGLRPDTDS